VKLGAEEDSSFIQWVDTSVLGTVLDYNVDGNLEYVGKGKPGARTDEAAWQIRRFYYDGNENLIEVRMPDTAGAPGVSHAGLVHIYDDRASLNYPTIR
jgi:hypothetical protein